jgi:phosphatidylglycerophosphate synthase
VISLSDIAVLFASIYWFEIGGSRGMNPIRAPYPYIIRIVIYCGFFVLLASGITLPSIAIVCGWYIIVITAVCHAFYAILQTLNFKDAMWLAGTCGSIGVPNWISITRIALSLLVPHLYAAQPLGEISNIVGTAILAIAMLSDAVDGFFARKLKAFTKAGKALDPLGDKVVFYPVVAAFLIASSGTAFLEIAPYRVAFLVALGIMAFRDIAFIVWFALYHNKIGEGIGAGMVDKVRMVFMCIFLGLIALTLTIPSVRAELVFSALIALIVVALLSILSIIVDLARFRNFMKNH